MARARHSEILVLPQRISVSRPLAENDSSDGTKGDNGWISRQDEYNKMTASMSSMLCMIYGLFE